jgi:hypothetical protein
MAMAMAGGLRPKSVRVWEMAPITSSLKGHRVPLATSQAPNYSAPRRLLGAYKAAPVLSGIGTWLTAVLLST